MKKWLLIITFTCFLVSCSSVNNNETPNKDLQGMNLATRQNNHASTKVGYINKHDKKYVSVDEVVKALGYSYQYDDINRSLVLNNGKATYSFLYGVPVLNKGVEHIPTSRQTLEIIEDVPYLSVDFFKKQLQAKVQENNEAVLIKVVKDKIDVPAIAEPEAPKGVEEIISLLSILENPIKGANVSTVPSHLPGAKRAYRHGTHEGMDFYQYSSKVTINIETPVYGMADGKIVRADHDYKPYPSEKIRNKDLQIAATYPATPEYMLDKLRGKQVWISYENGILARYAHLDSIPATVQVGDLVTKDTIVGYVGNSGTSGEVKKDHSELHLHLDLLIHNELFWKGLNSEQVKQILKSVFEK